jgi:hypothetical protein
MNPFAKMLRNHNRKQQFKAETATIVQKIVDGTTAGTVIWNNYPADDPSLSGNYKGQRVYLFTNFGGGLSVLTLGSGSNEVERRITSEQNLLIRNTLLQVRGDAKARQQTLDHFLD